MPEYDIEIDVTTRYIIKSYEGETLGAAAEDLLSCLGDVDLTYENTIDADANFAGIDLTLPGRKARVELHHNWDLQHGSIRWWTSAEDVDSSGAPYEEWGDERSSNYATAREALDAREQQLIAKHSADAG